MAKDPYADLAAKYGVSEGSSDNYDDLAAKYGIDQKTDKPTAVAGLDAGPAAKPSEPGFFDRLATGFGRMGDTVAAGGKVLFGHSPLVAALSAPEGQRLSSAGKAFTDSMKDVTDPSRRREVERGLDNMITLGYGQRLADRLGSAAGDQSLSAQQAEADRAAAPGYREAGTLMGLASPGASSTIAKGGAGAVKFATGGIKAGGVLPAAALGAGKALASYEATAPVISGLSADAEGHRMDAAREAATDPAGLLLAGTTGAGTGLASRVKETAPARLLARTRKDITTGDQNAGIRMSRKVSAAAGEDDARLADLFKHDPELEKTLAIKASTSPQKAVKAAVESVARVDDRLDEIYDKMAKADRLVTPSDIAIGFDKLLGQRLKDGDLPAVKILRAERARFLSEYGNYGKLSPDTMRGLKRTAGKAAFEGQPIPGNVKKDIWAAYADAIERQAKGTEGVDLDELRSLNRDMSVLIPIRNALDERATSARQGRHSIGEHIARSAMAGAGFAHGGIKEGVIGLAAPELIKAGQQAVRAVDYNLAKKYKGVAPDASAARGAKIGTLSYAARVTDGLQRGLSLAEAVEAAGEED